MNKVYYALTADEARKAILTYPKRPGYDGKGVHVSLVGLKKYVKEFKLRDLKYYTELDISQFEVVPGVHTDPTYHMVMVKTPFSFMIKHVKEL